jgi:hypothetical protein
MCASIYLMMGRPLKSDEQLLQPPKLVTRPADAVAVAGPAGCRHAGPTSGLRASLPPYQPGVCPLPSCHVCLTIRPHMFALTWTLVRCGSQTLKASTFRVVHSRRENYTWDFSLEFQEHRKRLISRLESIQREAIFGLSQNKKSQSYSWTPLFFLAQSWTPLQFHYHYKTTHILSNNATWGSLW